MYGRACVCVRAGRWLDASQGLAIWLSLGLRWHDL